MKIFWSSPFEGTIERKLNICGTAYPQVDKIKSLSYGIAKAMETYLFAVSQAPMDKDDVKIKWCDPEGKVQMEAILKQIFPRIDRIKQEWLSERIHKEIIYFRDTIQWKIISPKTNFLFLIEIGKNRNWKTDCCICLRSPLHGTYWVQFPLLFAMMFRPCGHAVCYECFQTWSQIDKRSWTENPTCHVKIPASSFLKCPLCRNRIQSAFRVDKVNHKDSDLFDNYFTPLSKQISNDLSTAL